MRKRNKDERIEKSTYREGHISIEATSSYCSIAKAIY